MLEVIVTQVQDYERSHADFCNHFQSWKTKLSISCSSTSNENLLEVRGHAFLALLEYFKIVDY